MIYIMKHREYNNPVPDGYVELGMRKRAFFGVDFQKKRCTVNLYGLRDCYE